MMSVYVVMLLIVLATAGTVMAQEESLTLKYASLVSCPIDTREGRVSMVARNLRIIDLQYMCLVTVRA